jgi:hypothetical protein
MPIESALIRDYLARIPPPRPSKRDQQRLAKLLDFCEGLPELKITPVGERHLSLAVRRKTLAYYMHDHHGDGRVCICCKSTAARQRELVSADPQRYYVPAYLGVQGWVSVSLDLPRIDWDAVFERLIEAYRLQAPRRLAEELA